MNVDRRTNEHIDPAIWDGYDMRMALAQRDIAVVFRILQKYGVSQRRIAALTGQSQSEISEIMSGRIVMAYDVLVRICDGLGVPRSHMGLAHDPLTTAMLEEGSAPPNGGGQTVVEDSRLMLARVVQLAVGPVELDPNTWWQPFERFLAPMPKEISVSDVERLEKVTAMFRAMDNQYGGGACRDAVVAQAHTAQQLLRSSIPDGLAPRLFTALADLQCIAGWSSFDIGLYVPARRHFSRALEQARYADQPGLVAKIMYCIGRMHLYLGQSVEALRLFQVGQISAQEAGSGLAMSLLAGNEALAYAVLGDSAQAIGAAGRAKSAYGNTDLVERQVHPWYLFMDAMELQSLVAHTYAALPEPTTVQQAVAMEGLYVAVGLRERNMNRSKALETIALAQSLQRYGQAEDAERLTTEAQTLAGEVRSERVAAGLAQLARPAGSGADAEPKGMAKK